SSQADGYSSSLARLRPVWSGGWRLAHGVRGCGSDGGAMQGDRERIKWVRPRISSAGCDAFLSCINSHVVMLSGYGPVLGQSFVLFPAKGEPCLIVPESELSLARQGFIQDVRTYPD